MPELDSVLQNAGYELIAERPLPPQGYVLENIVVFGIAGLVLGLVIGGRWPATLALSAGAAAGTWTVGSGLRLAKKRGPWN